MANDAEAAMEGIIAPHEHDVLSGRGNFVNYHAGNEHFRALVRKHKVAYVACPKAQKGTFSKLIVDEIKALDPPGRFLKQDPKTKLWSDIGEKKALDKTRQALREGAPEIMKELNDDDDSSADQSPRSPCSPIKSPTRVDPNLSQRLPSPQAIPRMPLLSQPSPGVGNYDASGVSFVKSPTAAGMTVGVYEAAARMSQMHRMGQAMHVPTSPYHLPQHIGSNMGMMPMPQNMVSPLSQPPQQVPFHPGLVMLDQRQQQQQQQQHQDRRDQLQQQLQMPPPNLGHGNPMQGTQGNAALNGVYPPNNNAIQAKMNTLKSPAPFLSCFDPRPLCPPQHVNMHQPQPPSNEKVETTESEYVGPLPTHHHHHRKSSMKRRSDLRREGSDHSLQADSLFAGIKILGTGALNGTNHSKSHNGSSNHLSAISGMSLSIGDMGADGSASLEAMSSLDSVKGSSHADPLSLRFNNSLRLGQGGGTPGRQTSKSKKVLDGSSKYFGSESHASEMLGGMDMSVATLGDRMSDFGDMSSASQGNMSFSNVFEETDNVLLNNR